ncbi:DUF3562 domain-containing protein [Cupriavidus pauculus]|uniref:DUF3562 domain-containing protein n=1 Tax=Cupriavidus pauculus TaxID=82633 RepID=A0A2N5CDE7_9BURK|nr:DUF3562 domain-containing protein [Cupriavidus pauculus]PLQ00239.1 hypothetical protein CYJ10_11285 [Cupriavidus pauculus]
MEQVLKEEERRSASRPASEAPATTHGHPPAGEVAISRIAAQYNAPRERVAWIFWNVWDEFLVDATIPDYLLILTERRVTKALRRRQHTA